MSTIKLTYASFYEFSPAGFCKVEKFAILPYGGAYQLISGNYELIQNTDNVYDLDDLRTHFFDLNR